MEPIVAARLGLLPLDLLVRLEALRLEKAPRIGAPVTGGDHVEVVQFRLLCDVHGIHAALEAIAQTHGIVQPEYFVSARPA